MKRETNTAEKEPTCVELNCFASSSSVYIGKIAEWWLKNSVKHLLKEKSR